jgi:hypothetical protein
MTKQEYLNQLEDLNKAHSLKVSKLKKEFALSNQKYKKGDIVKDCIKIIRITKVKYGTKFGTDICECIYTGEELTKKLQPKKSGAIGNIYQSCVEEQLNKKEEEASPSPEASKESTSTPKEQIEGLSAEEYIYLLLDLKGQESAIKSGIREILSLEYEEFCSHKTRTKASKLNDKLFATKAEICRIETIRSSFLEKKLRNAYEATK